MPSAPLLRDASFWGMTLTQFLGAFNDNVYKTTLMLLFVAVPVGIDSATNEVVTRDIQGEGSVLFGLPFILFSGFAGYLSDRYGKRTVIVLCKVAEVAIMVAGLALFVAYGRGPINWPMVYLFSTVLFLMGTHSAFFGPGKYGILPELFREKDLPTANGFILMTTFLAIIFGVVLAGWLKQWFEGQLWVVGVVCVAIAVVGVATSLIVRRTPPVQSDLPFEVDMLGVPRDMRALLWRDSQLHVAVWVSSVFWLVAAMVQLAVIALGKLQLEAGDGLTSVLVGTISFGIVIGSPLAGFLSQGKFHTGVLKAGAWGLFVCLALLTLPGGPKHQLLGYTGSVACLLAVGIFTGMFAVPLQVFLQMRPPRELKGRMIATMNLMNFTGITLSGGLYAVISWAFTTLGLPPSAMFGVTAAIFFLIAVLYHPREDAKSEKLAEEK
jgi:acyl-[acyl-carrier-protein]-phospholipid O-acyltransferase/long-chain-fatty-acid--[acyl-carrier-protein] ligase